MILGVCDWLGFKFNVDPTIFRVIFAVSVLVYGTGIAMYLILWIVKILSE